MRSFEIKRETGETSVEIALNIDGDGISKVNTGCGFLDHMLTLFSKHGGFDLTALARGDVEVDYHHTVEDVGITLGKAFKGVLSSDGATVGIRRYGSIILPMDETLILAAVDVSGRAHLEYTASIPTAKVGDFDTELCEEFFRGFVREAGITLHVRQLAGTNSHHIIEGIFKAVARALSDALYKDARYGNSIPSTKGVL